MAQRVGRSKARIWITLAAAAVAVIGSFSVGFSSGLSWGDSDTTYANKDASLTDQGLTDEQMAAVRARIRECLPVRLESYLDACLAGTEKDWEPTNGEN